MSARNRKRRAAVQTPSPSPLPAKLDALRHGRAVYVAASLAVLIPCFWQSRVQAGDLSSHLYNAWLADLIRQGQAPGLVLVRQSTNILFDWMLSALFRFAGADAAQRVSVAIAVLAFVWGAFAFVSAVSGSRAWHLLPVIGILAYGWVFHMGFFNFYLSMGLSLGALAICWKGNPRQCVPAVPLLAVAWLAHALPVVWALGLLAYLWTARRMPDRFRAFLLPVALLAMALLSVAVRARFTTLWLRTQVVSATGLDQVWVYDGKYLAVSLALLCVWGLLFAGLIRESGWKNLVLGIPFQFCMLTAFAVLVFPTSVLIPGYKHTLAYIADRMSLPLTVCFCAVVASAPRRVNLRYFAGAAAVVFFAFLFHDERALNAFEDRMDRRVESIQPWQRVISAVGASGLRVNALAHMIDRVCVGRCYSYANYEPSTAQFRVRAGGESPLIVSTYGDSLALQMGTYRVQQRDLPLYQINLDAKGRMITLSLKAGAPCTITDWNPW
ncbi:MAG TPA: hypothetical protein VMH81_10655 [Bryobacteraceae bacterium]|nr:hypothetical protein [Bryobacteraceae bacterium]